MRRRTCARAALLCALAAPAAVPATAAAVTHPAAPHPVHNHGLTIAATPDPIVAGTGVLIYGQLKGGDVAGQTVHLWHRINPASRFTIISTTKTNAEGFYEFTRAEGVVVSNRNWYVTGPGASHSKTVHERVSSTLTLSESASATTTGSAVTFSGSVYPSHPHERVLIQEQSSSNGNSWHTVATGRTNGASAYSISHAFRSAGDYTLRAYLPTDNRNLAGTSDAATLTVQQKQNPSFTITSSATPITVGASATISGTEYAPGSTTVPAAAAPVNLYGRTVGGRFTELASTVTGADGSYSFTQMPQHNMVYRVESATQAKIHSANLYEAVADSVNLTPSTTATQVGTQVSFTGTMTPDKSGHAVFLQIQTAKGGWQDVRATVARTGSRYTFAYRFGQPGTYQVRARIFGGPVNVGSASTPVAITVSGDAPAATLPAAS